MRASAPGAGAVLGATVAQTQMVRLVAARADGGEPLCVELLHPELADGAADRLPAAVQAAASVHHGSVVATVGEIHPSGWHGVVTEAVAGMRLTELAPRGEALPPAAALAVAEGLLGAVEAVHAAGLAHGAVSPEVTWVGVDGVVRLDGLAAALAVAADRAAGVPGDFQSPERRAGGPATPAADVWAAAAVCHTLLTGRPPGGDGSVAVQISARLAERLAPGLAADPEARPTAAELRGALVGAALSELGFGWRRVADLATRAEAAPVDWSLGTTDPAGVVLPPPPRQGPVEAPPAVDPTPTPPPAVEVEAAPPAVPAAAAPPRRRRRRALVWTLVLAVVVVVAGAGGGAALVLLGGRASTPTPAGPLSVGNDVHVSVSAPEAQSGPGVCDNLYHITATGSLSGKGTLVSHFDHGGRPSGDIVSPVDGNPAFSLTTDVRIQGRQQGTDSISFVITAPVQRQVSQAFSITCLR